MSVRRSRPSPLARLRSLWLVFAVLIAALGYGAYAFVTAQGLRVHDVAVHIEGKMVTASAVLTAARVDPDANVWLLDTRAIETRVDALPYVLTARLERALPADVTIEVTEREPFACLVTRASRVTIDETQRVLEAGCAHPGLVRIDLPDIAAGRPGATISAPALGALTTDIATLRTAHLTITSVGRDRFGGLTAFDPAGIELRFGEDTDLAKKAALVGPVRAALAKGRSIRAVDLRAPGTPTVEFRS